MSNNSTEANETMILEEAVAAPREGLPVVTMPYRGISSVVPIRQGLQEAEGMHISTMVEYANDFAARNHFAPWKYSSLSRQLRKLTKRGIVERAARGIYYLPPVNDLHVN